MSDKCKKCNKAISTRNVKIRCADCKGLFHGTCVNITKDDAEVFESGDQIWRCEPCQKERRSSMLLESSLSETSPNISDVIKLLHEMKEDSKKQMQNLEAELGKSIDSCHQTMEELKGQIESQSKSLDKYKEICENLLTENKELRHKVIELENRQDEAEQYSRLNTLEFNGIPELVNENVLEIIKKVGTSLGVEVTEDMVDACHRLGPKNSTQERPRGIICKFVRRIVKEEILIKRKIRRNLNTSDVGFTGPANVIYINESLTQARRRVYNAVRALKKQKNFTFVWIKNGKILVRPSEGDRVTALTNMSDVDKLSKLSGTSGPPKDSAVDVESNQSTAAK